MSAFTCISCRVAFADADLQRSHYKTDWHRYNLKRKVADLPPVTAEIFAQRVLAQRAQAAEADLDTSSHCQVCNKHFNTQNAYDNHVQSKRHKEAEVKCDQKSTADRKKSKNQESIPKEVDANDLVSLKNARNQAIKDSMQGPVSAEVTEGATGTSVDSSGARPKVKRENSRKTESANTMEIEDCSDAESEESWDGDALGEEECLFCGHISSSLENNVQHMSAKHSFFLPDIEYLVDLPGLILYLGEKIGQGHICLWCNEKSRMYYSVKAVQQHMLDTGHCKMKHEEEALFEYADYYDYRKSYPDADDRLSGEAAGGSTEEPMEEDEVKMEEMDGDNFALVLPSGATVGHRSLQRYYRQKLKPTREVTPYAVSKVMAQYKALGWTGTTGPGAERRAKDVNFVQRLRSRQHMKLSLKANKFQTYYRPQVIF